MAYDDKAHRHEHQVKVRLPVSGLEEKKVMDSSLIS